MARKAGVFEDAGRRGEIVSGDIRHQLIEVTVLEG
jgi:hypothetical protein